MADWAPDWDARSILSSHRTRGRYVGSQCRFFRGRSGVREQQQPAPVAPELCTRSGASSAAGFQDYPGHLNRRCVCPEVSSTAPLPIGSPARECTHCRCSFRYATSLATVPVLDPRGSPSNASSNCRVTSDGQFDFALAHWRLERPGESALLFAPKLPPCRSRAPAVGGHPVVLRPAAGARRPTA